MKIIDLLDDKSIRLNAEVHSKKEVLDTLVDLMDASGKSKLIAKGFTQERKKVRPESEKELPFLIVNPQR